MKTLVWTDTALQDYHQNIEYLLQKWSEKEALNFISDVESVLFELIDEKVEFKESGYRNIRQCVVCKQITLYYRHKSSNEIELLRFWNNHKDTRKLNL